jgi:hypothetical protein
MGHQLPEPPEAVPARDGSSAEPAKRRVRYVDQTPNQGKRWLITAAVVLGGRALFGMIGAQGDTPSAAAACVDTTKFSEELRGLDTWMAEVNYAFAARDAQRVEGDLRTIGGILDNLAQIAAADPAVAITIHEGAAHARAAADAIEGGEYLVAEGYVSTFNDDLKVVAQAGEDSTVPAC